MHDKRTNRRYGFSKIQNKRSTNQPCVFAISSVFAISVVFVVSVHVTRRCTSVVIRHIIALISASIFENRVDESMHSILTRHVIG